MRLLFVAALALSATSCDEATVPVPGFSLEQMNEQPRFGVWDACDYFPDGRAMRTPPEGTLARETRLDDPALANGPADRGELQYVPLPTTRAHLEAGRRHFDTACAVCHGVDGSGESTVAAKMRLRRPPSLVDAAARGLAPERIFQAVSRGYGLMPPLYDVLSLEARREVVAYVGVLQRSQAIALSSLAPGERARAEAALP